MAPAGIDTAQRIWDQPAPCLKVVNEQKNQAQKEQRTNFVLSGSDRTDIAELFPLIYLINL